MGFHLSAELAFVETGICLCYLRKARCQGLLTLKAAYIYEDANLFVHCVYVARVIVDPCFFENVYLRVIAGHAIAKKGIEHDRSKSCSW